jgi:secreted trypsin-like serine protease
LSSELLSHQYVTALVGKHNLSIADEPGSTHSVHEIILHPDWNSESVKSDADISIVVLHNSVEFTRNVEPICLPRSSDDEVVGIGTVVGWSHRGHSEAAAAQHDSTPNDLEASAVRQAHCFLTVKSLVRRSSFRTFCAGFTNLSQAPCSGDNSGGFYLRDSSTKLFSLQGIVSVPNYDCDVNIIYTIYTNVARFIDWIKNEMDKSKEV